MVNDKLDLGKIKLIIWDLDETFWKGTLSEGNVDAVLQHVELVKKLTKRGIINTICSKNDYNAVEQEFAKNQYAGVFSNFVFVSINWLPKGQRIKDLIQNMSLRPTNVLFIDDNVSNLNEAKYYCPELNIASPDIIGTLMEKVDTLGKDDQNLSRLQQYKVLETKYKARQNSSSNLDFLKDCNIKINIVRDCLSEKSRLIELINRSNQLNYTKIRLGEEDFLKIVNNSNYECAYVTVKDKFGDYGIVGFYCLDTNSKKLIHFVFSCRILGMGVDQYLYQKLNFPSLEVIGEVSSNVEAGETVDYISEAADDAKQHLEEETPKDRVLFKGPCDLESVLPYLKGIQIDKEFIHPNEDEPHTVSQQCLNCIVQSHKYTKEYCDKIVKDSMVLSSYDFTTNMFSGAYKYVFLSTLLEGQIALYRHKTQGYYVPYGLADYDFTDSKNWDTLLSKEFSFKYGVNFTLDMLKKLSDEFEYVGLPSAENFAENITYIVNNLPKQTKLVLILGSEIECANPSTIGYEHAATQYRIYNKLLRENLSKFSPPPTHKVQCINITDLIEDQSDFTNCTNHFSRNVYYKLAVEINRIIKNDIVTLPSDVKKTLIKYKILYWTIQLKRMFFYFSRKKQRKYHEKMEQCQNKISALQKMIEYYKRIK